MSSKVVRPVGTSALFNTSRHALGICRRVCNTCRYTIPRRRLDDQDLETIIEQAVATVTTRHGILRVGIVGEETKEPHFSSVEAIDFRHMVRWESLPDAREAYDDAQLRSLERIHDGLWEDLANRPGWEVIVHHSRDNRASDDAVLDITFAFHHAYADGVASKLFHRDLLNALNGSNRPPTELKGHVLSLSSASALLPGMETLVPIKISWAYLLRTIWNEIIWQNFVPSSLKSPPAPDSIPWTGKNISTEPHHVNIRLIEIPQSTLSTVVRACRQYDTTLTPLLHVLIATSLAQRMPRETAPAFSTTTPIDLRRYAKPEYDVENTIVCVVSAQKDALDSAMLSSLRRSSESGDDSLWQAASSLSTRLRQKISSLPSDDLCGLLSWVSDWQKFWTDKFGGKRDSTWEVSNIGSVKGVEATNGSKEGWRINRSVMTQGALPAGAAFSVNVASVEHEGLCLTLTWQEKIVETDLMDGLAADLGQSLRRISETGI